MIRAKLAPTSRVDIAGGRLSTYEDEVRELDTGVAVRKRPISRTS